MGLSTYAKGTIVFSVMLMFGMLWLAISPVFDSPWEPWEPLVPLMSDFAVPFVNRFYRPLLVALMGIALFWVWTGRRAGYLLALLLAAVGAVFTAIITFGNVMNGTWLGALTTVSALVPAVLAVWFSYRGWRSTWAVGADG